MGKVSRIVSQFNEDILNNKYTLPDGGEMIISSSS
jgi:hypothetical protein